MDRHLSSRLQTLNLKKTLHYVNHDFRRDYTNHIKNDNQNFYYINNDKDVKLFSYKKMKDKKLNKSKNKDFTDLNRIKKILDETIIKHNELYLKKYKTKLRTDRTNSFNGGVLTFPKDLENDLKGEKFNKKEFITLGIKTIKEICKYLDIKLIYVTVHFDETTPHFHYLTENFNSEGKTITRNRTVGKKIQDISEMYFKNFGISRGVSKEVTGRKNITNEIDKLKNQLKEIQEENKKIKEENQELKIQNEELIKNILINETEYNKLLTDVKTLKEEYIKFNDDVETKKEFYKSVLNPILLNLKQIEKDYQLFTSKTLISSLTDEQLKQRINRINNTFKNVKENIESPKFQNVKKQLEDYFGFSM